MMSLTQEVGCVELYLVSRGIEMLDTSCDTFQYLGV